MITLKFNDKAFKQQMDNLMEYSVGFVEGMVNGKKTFLENLAPNVAELASEFIDVNAKIDKPRLHHMYEWMKTGSPESRLFDIRYSTNQNGIKFFPEYRQSVTIANGMTQPFRNKAEIMELGQPVTIEPKEAQALRFEIDGEVIYTKGIVTVENPGGNTQGQFQDVFNLFFNKYFTQAFLKTSGLYEYFKNPKSYKINLRKGMVGGRSAGLSTGFAWVAGARFNK